MRHCCGGVDLSDVSDGRVIREGGSLRRLERRSGRDSGGGGKSRDRMSSRRGRAGGRGIDGFRRHFVRIPGLDDRIELTITQGNQHPLVLVLHHLPHEIRHLVHAEVLGVARLHGLEDAAPVHEEVRDDVRVANSRVFGLDVEDPVLVPDVVVVAEEG